MTQIEMMRANDPAAKITRTMDAAEELRLTRRDADELAKRHPERYACLKFWRATDERA